MYKKNYRFSLVAIFSQLISCPPFARDASRQEKRSARSKMLFEQPANVDISGGASESGKANSYFDGLPAGCYLASLISDKGGRKMPMIVMYLLAAVMALCFSAFYDNFYSVALCGFLLSVFNMAGGFIMFSYTAESYPTHMRSSVPADRNRVDCPLPIYAIFIRTLLCNYD